MAIMRSDQVIDEVVSALAGARRSIVGEHFVITDEAAIEASHAAVGRGVRGTILGDAEMSKVGDLRVPSEFEVTVHGDLDWKLHTKLTTIDGERALLSTTGLSNEHRADPMIDMLFTTTRDAAVLEELTLAGVAGDRARMVRAAQAAADVGYLLNDPGHGILHLRNGVHALADAAVGDSYIGVKVLDEDNALRRFADAADATGSRLRVETHDGPKRWREAKQAAERADVDIVRLGTDADGLELHANVVVAQTAEGPRMIAMTAPFTERGLAEPGAPRLGREIGVMVDDPDQIRAVLERIGELDGSKASKVASALFE